MQKIIDWLSTKLPKVNLEDDDSRVHTQFVVIFFVLSIVSSFMTFLNYLTNWTSLAKLTLALAVINLLSLIIETQGNSKKTIRFGRIFFAASIIAVFTLFAIVGEPEGFSILWSLILPACGFFLFRSRYGFIIGGVQFVIIVFLFYTPIGRSLLQYDYTGSFLQRFPVIYMSFMIVGYIFEYVRSSTQEALVKSKEEYQHLFNHDSLTGLYNRYGFNSTFEDYLKVRDGHQYAFAILDIDHFKNVNDKYGHQVGDLVLKEIALRLKESVCEHCLISRWGGEEFSILFRCEHNVEEQCNKLLDKCRNQKINIGNEEITVLVSIGVVFIQKDQDVDMAEVLKKADDNLYRAKHNGRNQVVYTNFE